MSFSAAGPSRYPSLPHGSENGSSPSFSPIPEGNQSWSGAYTNGHSDEASREAGSKRNPLVDLIDSEKAYVDQLALVIRVSEVYTDIGERIAHIVARRSCLVKKGLPTAKAGFDV